MSYRSFVSKTAIVVKRAKLQSLIKTVSILHLTPSQRSKISTN